MLRSKIQRINKHRKRNQRGFTLIEVLVSIAIFASMSVAAYQVVSQVQRSNVLSQERTQRLNELQRAMVMMDNDFRQMAMRQMRTNGEEPSKQLLFWSDYLLDSDAKGVMFARLGWHNPLNSNFHVVKSRKWAIALKMKCCNVCGGDTQIRQQGKKGS